MYISVFSLHPRKFITTGEGGLITTNTEGWAERMRSNKHFGMESGDTRSLVRFKRIGSNHNLSEVLAAIGLVQMRHVYEFLAKRRKLAERYLSELSNISGITIPKATENGRHSYQSCCIFIENLDQVMKQLQERDIQPQIGTYALHMHKAFNDNSNCRIEGELSGSRYAFEHCLTLPRYHEMTDDVVGYVIGEIKRVSGKR